MPVSETEEGYTPEQMGFVPEAPAQPEEFTPEQMGFGFTPEQMGFEIPAPIPEDITAVRAARPEPSTWQKTMDLIRRAGSIVMKETQAQLDEDSRAAIAGDPKAARTLFDERGRLTAKGTSLWDSLMLGIDQIQGIGYGLGMAGADIVGAEKLSSWLNNRMQYNQAEIEQNAPHIASFREIGKGVPSGPAGAAQRLRQTAKYGLGAVAENVPMIATTMGAGGVVGQVAKRGLTGVASEVLTKEAAQAAMEAAARRTAIGEALGVWGASSALEAGSIYEDMAQRGIRGPVPAMTALAASLPAGFLDAIMPVAALRRVRGVPYKSAIERFVESRIGKEMMDKGIAKLGVAGFEGVLTEGPTEYFQTAIEQAATLSQDPKTQGAFWKFFFSEPYSQERWEALAKGAFVGGLLGGIAQAGGAGGKAVRGVAERTALQRGAATALEQFEANLQRGIPVPAQRMPELPGTGGAEAVRQALSLGLDQTARAVAGTETSPQAKLEQTRNLLAKPTVGGVPLAEAAAAPKAPFVEAAPSPFVAGGRTTAAQQQMFPNISKAVEIPATSAAPEVLPQPRSIEALGVQSVLKDQFPQLSIDVVDDGAQFPQAARDYMASKGINPDSVHGIYHNGRVILNAKMFPAGNPAFVFQKVVHEVAIHQGLRMALGEKRFQRLAKSVWQGMSEEDRQRIMALNKISPTDVAEIGEEWLAYEAERVAAEGVTNDLWSKIVMLFRQAARKLGLRFEFTDVEIAQLIAKGFRAVQPGAEAGAQPVAGAAPMFSAAEKAEVDAGNGGVVVQQAAIDLPDPQFTEKVADVMAQQMGEPLPDESVTDPWTEEEQSGESIRFSIEPPVRMDRDEVKNWVWAMSPDARASYEFYRQFKYEEDQLQKQPQTVQKYVEKGKPRRWVKMKKGPVFNRSLTTQEMNEWAARNPHVLDAFKRMAPLIDDATRERMGLGLDGVFKPGQFDESGLFVYRSFMQRLMDARDFVLTKQGQPIGYQLADTGQSVMIAPPGTSIMTGVTMPLDEDYRQSILRERRRQHAEGTIKKVAGPGAMSFDRWGTMGFTAKNDKTIGSGDFTTICPQMYINNGCHYCYRRAALESNINNKLGAEKVWYTGEFLRLNRKTIEQMNAVGGFRIQSFGDFMQEDAQTRAMIADMLYDAELVGLQIKIITKNPTMIDFVAQIIAQRIPVKSVDGKISYVGEHMFFNLSVDYFMERQGDPRKMPLTFDPNRPFEKIGVTPQAPSPTPDVYWKRALTVEEADQIAKKYPWVNIRTVGLSVDEFVRGLMDPRVQVITGYHGDLRQFERVSILEDGGRRVEVEVEPIGNVGMPRFDPKTGELVFVGKTESHRKLAFTVARLGLQRQYMRKACCVTGKCASCLTRCGADNAAKYTGGTSFSSIQALRENRLTVERTVREYQAIDLANRITGKNNKEKIASIVDAIEQQQLPVAQLSVGQPTAVPEAAPAPGGPVTRMSVGQPPGGEIDTTPAPAVSAEPSTQVEPGAVVSREDKALATAWEKPFETHDMMMTRFSVEPRAANNESMNAMLAELGQPELSEHISKPDKVLLAKVQRRIRRDTSWLDDILKKFEKKPYQLSDEETVGLDYWTLVLRTEARYAAKKACEATDQGNFEEAALEAKNTNYWGDELKRVTEILRATGTMTAQAFRARQLAVKWDFTVDTMIHEKRKNNGFRELSAEEIAEINKKSAEYQEKVKALLGLAEAEAKKVAGEEIDAARDAVAQINPEVMKFAQDWVANLERKATTARQRFAVKWNRLRPGQPMRLSAEPGAPVEPLPPELMDELAIMGASLLASNITAQADWEAAMIADTGDFIQPYLAEARTAAEARLARELQAGRQEIGAIRRERKPKPAPAAPTTPAAPVEPPSVEDRILISKAKIEKKLTELRERDAEAGATPDELYYPVQELIRLLIEQNPLITRDELINTVHTILQPMMPGITLLETMDAISGRGRVVEPDQSDLAKIKRDLKAQTRIFANITDLRENHRTKATGFKYDKPTDEQRRLKKELDQLKKQYPDLEDATQQLQSYLAARKSWYRNRIADLKYEIAKRELIVRPTVAARLDQNSPGVKELNDLKAEYAQLMAEHEQIFVRPELTDEQRLALAEKAAERQIKLLEQQLADARLLAAAEKKPSLLTSAKLEAMRQRILQLKVEREWARDRSLPQPDVKTKEDAKRWLELNREIKNIQEQLDNERPFAPGKKIRPADSPATQAMAAKLEELKRAREYMRQRLQPKPEVDPVEVAIMHRMGTMRRQIADYMERLATRDFEPRKRKPPLDITRNEAAMRLQAERDAIRLDWEKEGYRDRMANRTKMRVIWDGIKQSMRIVPNLLASFDFSAMRQALIGFMSLTARVPFQPVGISKTMARVYWRMFRAAFSEKQARIIDKKIRNRINYRNGTDKIAGIEYSDLESTTFTRAEENARSLFDEWAEGSLRTGHIVRDVLTAPLKLVSRGVRGSNRAYITMLNTTRASLFDLLLQENFADRPPTDVELRVLGNWVNIATGRGKLNPKAAEVSSYVIWAPKLLTSRVQFLLGQPLWGGGAWQGSARARWIIAKEYARVVASGYLLSLVSSMFDEKKREPMTSSDWGKIVRGNTRIDLWGGLQQVTVLGARIWTGKTTTIKGKTIDLASEKTYGGDLSTVITKFVFTKLRPDVGAVKDLVTRKDFRGQLTSAKGVVGVAQDVLIPLPFQNIVQLMKDRGLAEGAAIEALNIFGAGVSVYTDKKNYEPIKSR